MAFLKSITLLDKEVLFHLFGQGELSDGLPGPQRTLVLLELGQLNGALMDHELVLYVVLEAHDHVVPNRAEPVLTLAHFLDNARIDMAVKVPALNVSDVASLDRHREAQGDHLPRSVVCGIC